MLKKLWKQMRWSLRTQVILVLFAGLLLLVWHRREPWEYRGSFDMKERQRDYGSISPDGGRVLLSGLGFQTIYVIEPDLLLEDNSARIELAVLQLDGNSLLEPSFFNNDTIVALAEVALNMPNAGKSRLVTFRRRFPEWWWGHFYRPEVWLLPLWLGLIVWTIRKDRAVPK